MASISDSQIEIVRVALGAAVDECSRSPTGNLLEGHLKSVIVDVLLRSGYGVLEGSTRNTGKHIRLQGNNLISQDEPRPKMAPRTGSAKNTLSPDIRVWSPLKLVLELQVRSVIGSQDALFSDNIVDDLDRVARGAADVFLLAADRKLYDALRGIKGDPRGRKAKHTATLALALPDPTNFPDRSGSSPAVSDCGGFISSGSAFATWFGIGRVVVALWKAA